jgi:hypothetical protein
VTATGTPGSAGAKTTIVVASGAPTLYYYCSSHSGMGGQVNTNSTAGATVLSASIRAASTVSSGNSYSAGWAGVGYVTWSNSDSWSGLSAVSNNGKGYFSGTENLSNGSVISAPNSPFNAPPNGAAGFVLRASATVTLRILVYDHMVEIATTDSDSQTFANRTIVATNPAQNSYVEATGKCFWWTTNNQVPSISAMGTFYDAPAVPSITSTVRANQSAGFSIVTWSAATNAVNRIPHLLNATPGLIITKSTSESNNWRIWHTATGKDKYLGFDTSVANTYSSYWSTSEPDSSTFGVWHDAGGANNHGDMVAYCFAPVEGYSAFGTYEGNGNANGPFVFTGGMRPKWILLKSIDTGGTGYDWLIYDTERDTYNVGYQFLCPNTNNTELRREGDTSDKTDRYIDILSNGFKIRNSNANYNANANTFLWVAFAEHPFKTARAR